MPRFKVFGAYRTNGQDCAQVFTADDEESAIARALEVMIVEKVIRLPDPLSPRSRLTPTVTAASLADPGGPLYSPPPMLPAEPLAWQATPTVPYATPAAPSPKRDWKQIARQPASWIVLVCVVLVALSAMVVEHYRQPAKAAGPGGSNAGGAASREPENEPLTKARVVAGMTENLILRKETTLGGEHVEFGEMVGMNVRLQLVGDRVTYAHVAIILSDEQREFLLSADRTSPSTYSERNAVELMGTVLRFLANVAPDWPERSGWALDQLHPRSIASKMKRTRDVTIQVHAEGPLFKFFVTPN
jgi:hypothetical protein